MPIATTPARWAQLLSQNRVSKWPHPFTGRVDARFRLLHVSGNQFPLASRFVAKITPFGLGLDEFYGFVDLVYIPANDHLFGSTGISNAGRELTLTVTQYTTLLDPIFSNHGIMFDWTYQKDGGGISHAYFLWSVDWNPLYSVPYNAEDQGMFSTWFRDSLGPVAPTDWTLPVVHAGFHWTCLSECYVVEEEAPPAPVSGFADLNAIDSDVIFDFRTDWNTDRFYLEFDIMNRAATGIVVLGKTFNTTQYFGFNGEYAFWNGYLTWMGEILTLDVWIHIRFEWQWIAADLTYRCYWDGVPKGTQVGALRFNQFDTIGKKGPAFVGDYKVKNLIYETGAVGSEVVLLDMPLDTDACDVGPDLIKGTTQNMVLPSCP